MMTITPMDSAGRIRIYPYGGGPDDSFFAPVWFEIDTRDLEHDECGRLVDIDKVGISPHFDRNLTLAEARDYAQKMLEACDLAEQYVKPNQHAPKEHV